MFKAIFFDFFDVIHTDSLRVWLKKYNLKKEGVYAQASHLIDSGDINEDEFIKMLSRASGIPSFTITTDFKKFATFDYEVIDIIKKLRKKYKLGLISNGGADYIRTTLQNNDLEILFDEVLISAEIGMLKPDLKIYKYMLDKLKLEPQETVFIDDHKNNIEAAQTLGMFGIIYTTCNNLKKQLNRIDIHVD